MAVEFKDNSIHVKAELNSATIAWLEEMSALLESQVKRNTKGGDSGLRDQWQHHVDKSKGEAIVGHPMELAIWYEFGTGIYAQNGDGRKDVPWHYQDDDGKWHATKGMHPHRPLQMAQTTIEPMLKPSLEAKLKGMK